MTKHCGGPAHRASPPVPMPQSGMVAVDLIGGEPGQRRQAMCAQRPFQHLSGQLGFAGDFHVRADPSPGTPLTVPRCAS